MKLKNTAEVKKLTLFEIVIPGIENRSLILIKDIALVLIFAVITGIAAQLKLEIGAVPVTGQTLVVLLAGTLLGSRKGALSQISYLFGGIFGVPWFSRGGGMAYVFSPTFGYIIGFIITAYLVGWFCEKGLDRQVKTAILAMLIGNIVLYIPGLLWLVRFVGFENVLAVGLYPFIIGDLLKILSAGVILPAGWKLVGNKK